MAIQKVEILHFVNLYFVLVIWVASFISTECVIFHNSPGAVTINEDEDAQTEVWSIEADCTYIDANYRCVRVFGSPCPILTNTTKACGDCSITSNPDPSLFFISGATIYKSSCSTPGCGVCSTCGSCGNGCLDYQQQSNYTLEITCVTTEGTYENDRGNITLTIVVEQNPVPTINLNDTVSVMSSSVRSGDIIFATSVVDPSGETIEYEVLSGVGNSYITGTPDLFDMYTESKGKKAAGEVYVNGDLSQEFTQTFIMEICGIERRNRACGTLTIKLDSCFQPPTCEDGSTFLAYGHEIGAPLWTVVVPEPNDQFTGQTFSDLSFSIDRTTLDVAQIDPVSVVIDKSVSYGRVLGPGVISTSDFIMVTSVYINTFTIEVRVANTESCGYTSTCFILLNLDSTPVGPESLMLLPTSIGFTPANQTSLLEDIDTRELLVQIYVYDTIYYEPVYYSECVLGNDTDFMLFELISGYNVTDDAYRIYKKACTDPGCGPVCNPDTGCMNFHNKNEYSVKVTCTTSFGSLDTKAFIFEVEENTPPVLHNLPSSVTADSSMGVGAVIFTLSVTDDGSEPVQYILAGGVPISYFWGTENLFQLDTASGNVYINADPIFEFTQTISLMICAMDRRNEVCGNLTIEFNGCFQIPTCQDATRTVNDTFSIGDALFSVFVPEPTDQFTGQTFNGLSFAIENTTLDVVQIDPFSGVITTTDFITIDPFNPINIYTLIIQVGNTDSCSYSYTCSMTLNVIVTNPVTNAVTTPVPTTLSINIGFTPVNTASLLEDVDTRELLVHIYVYDISYGPVENSECVLDSNTDFTLFDLTTGNDISNDAYRIYKKVCTDPGCGPVCSLDTGCMNFHIQDEFLISVTCTSLFGSSDTKTFTFLVEENTPPVLNNLPSTVRAHYMMTMGKVIFTVSVTDDGTETLQYAIASGVSPSLELGTANLFQLDTSSGKVYLNADPSEELTQTMSMTICVADRRNEVCGTLTIKFTGWSEFTTAPLDFTTPVAITTISELSTLLEGQTTPDSQYTGTTPPATTKKKGNNNNKTKKPNPKQSTLIDVLSTSTLSQSTSASTQSPTTPATESFITSAQSVLTSTQYAMTRTQSAVYPSQSTRKTTTPVAITSMKTTKQLVNTAHSLPNLFQSTTSTVPPVTTSEMSTTTSLQPTTIQTQSSVTLSQPVTVLPNPTTFKSQPVTTAIQTMTTQTQPTTTTVHFVTTPLQSITTTTQYMSAPVRSMTTPTQSPTITLLSETSPTSSTTTFSEIMTASQSMTTATKPKPVTPQSVRTPEQSMTTNENTSVSESVTTSALVTTTPAKAITITSSYMTTQKQSASSLSGTISTPSTTNTLQTESTQEQSKTNPTPSVTEVPHSFTTPIQSMTSSAQSSTFSKRATTTQTKAVTSTTQSSTTLAKHMTTSTTSTKISTQPMTPIIHPATQSTTSTSQSRTNPTKSMTASLHTVTTPTTTSQSTVSIKHSATTPIKSPKTSTQYTTILTQSTTTISQRLTSPTQHTTTTSLLVSALMQSLTTDRLSSETATDPPTMRTQSVSNQREPVTNQSLSHATPTAVHTSTKTLMMSSVVNTTQSKLTSLHSLVTTAEPHSAGSGKTDNTKVIASAAAAGALLVVLSAIIGTYFLTRNKAPTLVQPMPSKPRLWSSAETGKKATSNNKKTVKSLNSTSLPGQVGEPVAVPGEKMNPYSRT